MRQEVVNIEIEGPLPDDGTLPFRSARNPESSIHVDLDGQGYLEREFFVAGEADLRDPDGATLGAAEPYVTRVLVRRPRTEFSGTVYLEPFHVLAEDTPAWTSSRRHLMRSGDAWVGVTVNAGAAPPGGGMGGGVPMLQESDPGRYARLRLATLPPPPMEMRPDQPIPFDPEAMRRRLSAATPQGNAIIGQVASALRAPGTVLLDGSTAARVYATGWSQTGLFWRNHLDHGHHELVAAAHGSSPIDAYIINVAPAPDHRPADATLWHVLSEAEVVGTLNPPMTAAEDRDARGMVRGFEIPGAFHYWHLSKHTAGVEVGPEHPDRHNDRSWYHVTHTLLSHLDAWIRDGVVPPHAERIVRDPDSDDGVARDEFGNARGGLRNPWVDVPNARYLPRCGCNPGVGAMRPFTDAQLTDRYVSRAEYEARFSQRVTELVSAGWLLAADAGEISPGS